VEIYGFESGEWSKISELLFNNPIMNVAFRGNDLYLGVENWLAENLPAGQIFRSK
jgi:hypothetical protein